MVEEVAEEVVIGVTSDLLSTGIATGTVVTASEVRSYLRSDRGSVDLGEVANEFYEALEEAIESENQRRDTLELAGFTNNWQTIIEELAATPTAPDPDTRRDTGEVDILFTDEEEAVTRIAGAYAAVEDIPLDRMPQAREAIQDALIHAYRRAVEDFNKRLDDTDLEGQFERETGLVLAKRLADLQDRLTMMEKDVEHILTQEARNEGFRQFSRAFFVRQSPSPEQCWRIGFSLADVEAGIPAEREGLENSPASEELLGILREGENRMVVGRPGSGKSTLCKQVAVRWYEDDTLGEVLYRETGTGSQFTSTDALKQATDRARGPVLVVVEDAVREQANSIAETVEEFQDTDGVWFLLDARREELDAFEGTGSLDVDAHRRRGSVLKNVTEYSLPTLSVADVEQVCDAFADATEREVRRDSEALHDELWMETDLGIGEMLLLTFLLPVAGDQQEAAGLEAHVRARYETLNSEGNESIRDLSEFDEDLVAEVGAMVNLLNASGIGIHQELVHALAYEYGHHIETHNAIEDVLKALDGWVLFPNEESGPSRQTHPLWSTLYLRELALEHAESQASSQRRDRSEECVGTCLESLFRLFDDIDHWEALAAEFPGSPVLADISAQPQEQADEYLDGVFELGERWPVLAPLFGTTDTARYDLPDTTSYGARARTVTRRASTHFVRGAYSKARTEYEHQLDRSQETDDRAGIANSLNRLGLVAQQQGAYDDAREYHQHSLDISEELGDRAVIAHNLNNLGLVAKQQGAYDNAREYFEDSLDIFEELDHRAGIANSLGNLGLVARQQGAYDDAREYHQYSLDIKRELGDRAGIAASLGNLGLVAESQRAYDDARKYHQHSLDISDELGYRAVIADSLNNLGRVARQQGAYDDAREYFEDSLDIKRELGDRAGIASILGNLGLVARQQGAYDDARECFEGSIDILEELGMIRKELRVRRNLARLEIAAEESDRARDRCESTRTRLDEIDRDLSDERERLEQICAGISEE